MPTDNTASGGGTLMDTRDRIAKRIEEVVWEVIEIGGERGIRVASPEVIADAVLNALGWDDSYQLSIEWQGDDDTGGWGLDMDGWMALNSHFQVQKFVDGPYRLIREAP